VAVPYPANLEALGRQANPRQRAWRAAPKLALGTGASVLEGQDHHRTNVDFAPGDMVLFRGRHSLHRVTAIKGDTSRLMALMSFDNVEKAAERDVPDNLLPP